MINKEIFMNPNFLKKIRRVSCNEVKNKVFRCSSIYLKRFKDSV